MITKECRDTLALHLAMVKADRATGAWATDERKLAQGAKALLREWMVATYGPVCAWCGFSVAREDIQLGHLVPACYFTPGARGRKRGGIIPSNLAISCKRCNDELKDCDANPYTMARPDCVALAWPVFTFGSINGKRRARIA